MEGGPKLCNKLSWLKVNRCGYAVVKETGTVGPRLSEPFLAEIIFMFYDSLLFARLAEQIKHWICNAGVVVRTLGMCYFSMIMDHSKLSIKVSSQKLKQLKLPINDIVEHTITLVYFTQRNKHVLFVCDKAC